MHMHRCTVREGYAFFDANLIIFGQATNPVNTTKGVVLLLTSSAEFHA